MMKQALDRQAEQCDPIKIGFVGGAGGSTVCALNDLHETAKAENVVPL